DKRVQFVETDSGPSLRTSSGGIGVTSQASYQTRNLNTYRMIIDRPGFEQNAYRLSGNALSYTWPGNPQGPRQNNPNDSTVSCELDQRRASAESAETRRSGGKNRASLKKDDVSDPSGTLYTTGRTGS